MLGHVITSHYKSESTAAYRRADLFRDIWDNWYNELIYDAEEDSAFVRFQHIPGVQPEFDFLSETHRCCVILHPTDEVLTPEFISKLAGAVEKASTKYPPQSRVVDVP